MYVVDVLCKYDIDWICFTYEGGLSCLFHIKTFVIEEVIVVRFLLLAIDFVTFQEF